MKSCTCGTTGVENFWRNRNTSDGLQFYCKTCVVKRRREDRKRKYPNGKGKRGAPFGNKYRLKHGPDVGVKRKREPKPVVVPEPTYLDRLIRMPLA